MGTSKIGAVPITTGTQSTTTVPAQANNNMSTLLMKRAAAVNITQQSPQYYNPLLVEINLLLPTKIREFNLWARHFYKIDPIVRSAIDLHSTFPMTGFYNVCENSKVKAYFDNIAFNVLNLPKLMQDVALEYWKLGNVFIFGEWDDEQVCWKRFTILNPDYIFIEGPVFGEAPTLKLDPSDSLRRAVSTNQFDVINKLDPSIVQYVKRGERIPLSNFVIELDYGNGENKELEVQQACHLAMKLSPYESIGIPLVYSCFRALILKDKAYRMLQHVLQSHITPIKMVKIGSDTAPATPESMDTFKELLDETSQDPSAWLFVPHTVNIDYITSAGKIVPMEPLNAFIKSEVLMGLGVSEQVLQGAGPQQSKGSAGLDVLLAKYSRLQEYFSRWIEQNVYRPLSIIQGYIDKDTGLPIVPKVCWEMMHLTRDVAERRLMSELQQRGLISKRTIRSSLGLDYELEEKWIKAEKENDIKDKSEQVELAKQHNLTIPPEPGKPGAAAGVPPVVPGVKPSGAPATAPAGSPGGTTPPAPGIAPTPPGAGTKPEPTE